MSKRPCEKVENKFAAYYNCSSPIITASTKLRPPATRAPCERYHNKDSKKLRSLHLSQPYFPNNHFNKKGRASNKLTLPTKMSSTASFQRTFDTVRQNTCQSYLRQNQQSASTYYSCPVVRYQIPTSPLPKTFYVIPSQNCFQK